MNAFFKEIKEDQILFRSSILSAIIVFISVIYIFLFYQNLPPLLPIFNQMPWGEQRITGTIFIFTTPAIAILILIVNLIFAKYIYKRIPLIARIFSLTTFLICILNLLFIIRTIHAAL